MRYSSLARILAAAALCLGVSMAAAQQQAPPPPSALTVTEEPPPPAAPAEIVEPAAPAAPAELRRPEPPVLMGPGAEAPAPPAAAEEPPRVEAMPGEEPPAAAPESEAVVPDEAAVPAAPVMPPEEAAIPEAPVMPPDEAAMPEAPVMPPDEAAPATAVAAEPKRVLILPLEFTVYERSVAGMEAVPDWTTAARANLLEATGQMLRQDSRFEIVAVPAVEGAAKDVLREHVELFKIISDTVTGVVHLGGKAWEDKKVNFDYTLGDGLAFLADASGADYAFILGGGQIKPTGGTTFMQILAAGTGVYVPGGGTYVAAGIVDLRTGNIVWLNSMQGGELFGMTSNDTRKPEAAHAILAKMFEGYPATRWVTVRPF